jgi:hypothetical protein
MKASPASNEAGASTATSFRRTSFSLAMVRNGLLLYAAS